MHHLPTVIPLDQASNLRDLGGWPVAGGRRVRRGLVYRAPALVGLSPADVVAIGGLQLRTVCDFRGVRERAASPVDIAGAQSVALPIEPSVGAGLRDILRTGEAGGHVTADEMLELLREAYLAYALASFDRYRAVFDLLLDGERRPLLMHCSAGKDRTGFGAALLLTALGVGWDHVMQDYLATNRVWRRETARNIELPGPVKEALLSAHSGLLEAAFEGVRAAYGSVDGYLEQAIGLDPQRRAALAGVLLEPGR